MTTVAKSSHHVNGPLRLVQACVIRCVKCSRPRNNGHVLRSPSDRAFSSSSNHALNSEAVIYNTVVSCSKNRFIALVPWWAAVASRKTWRRTWTTWRRSGSIEASRFAVEGCCKSGWARRQPRHFRFRFRWQPTFPHFRLWLREGKAASSGPSGWRGWPGSSSCCCCSGCSRCLQDKRILKTYCRSFHIPITNIISTT